MWKPFLKNAPFRLLEFLGVEAALVYFTELLLKVHIMKCFEN